MIEKVDEFPIDKVTYFIYDIHVMTCLMLNVKRHGITCNVN